MSILYPILVEVFVKSSEVFLRTSVEPDTIHLIQVVFNLEFPTQQSYEIEERDSGYYQKVSGMQQHFFIVKDIFRSG